MACDGGRPRGLAYTAKVEDVEIVDKVRESSGMLTQGTDMLLAYAGSIVGQGQHALYTIRVFCDGGTSTIKKRFSEFSALHAELVKSYPSGLSFDLPDKGLVRQFSEQALKDRVQLLNVYLKALCSRQDVAQHPAALAFFRVSAAGLLAPETATTAGEANISANDDPFAPSFLDTPASGRPAASSSPGMHTMTDDRPRSGGSRATYSACIDRFDIVGATSANEGVLGQGLDMLFSAAGSLTGTGGTYAVYTVKVQCEGQYSSLKKRFSEFEHMHSELKKAFPASLGFELPDKGMVRQFSNDALADRARALNAYLKALCGQREAAHHPAALTFFGLDKNGATLPPSRGTYTSSAAPEPVPTRAGAAINGRATAPIASGRRPDDEDDLAGWDTPSL